MTPEELSKRIYEISRLEGNFTLRSGQQSNYYFDKYRFESDPFLLREIARQLSLLIPLGTQVLAGLEMGGIPIATALALETFIPLIFVRKEAKTYGTEKLAEGLEFKGKNICLVEDVITTGGQVLKSAQEIRNLGGHVNNVVCVIQRGTAKLDGLNLFPLFNFGEQI